MPGLQVVNFGEDPYANAMGKFAKNFLGKINEGVAQRRNEELFSKISSKYGKDANPEDILMDIIKSEGLDEDYKRNKIKEIVEYADISNKKNKTLYDEASLETRRDDLLFRKDKEKKRRKEKEKDQELRERGISASEERNLISKENAENAAKKGSRDLPKFIDAHTNNLLKNSQTTLTAHDKADLNAIVEQLMTDKDNPKGINQAFNEAMQYIDARREKIDTFQVTPRPKPWIGQPNPQEVQQGMDALYKELKFMHDEDGIENQKELREVAYRGGWKPEEVTMILQRVFQEAGKKLRGPQGKAAQAAGIDDILFGE